MNSTSEILRTAVHQNPLASIQGIQQRLFSLFFNSFTYNQIWEDPRVDLVALELQADSQLLTIASGGCNILNYLTASPAQIVALDLNPYHLSLTRLKIAALEHLPDHESFYDFFGHANRPENIEKFERYILPNLDREMTSFWSNSHLLRKSRINLFRNGLYRHTRFGYFMRLLHWIARRTNYEPAKLLQAQTLEEQQQIFEEHIRPFFDNKLVKVLGKLPISVFSLGIPPQQYKAMKNEGNLIQQYCDRVERLACQFPVQDNYFAWQGFIHSYDHENRLAVPNYLKAEKYTQIKNQVANIETHSGSLIDYLEQRPDNSLDRFVFLDAQDWMSDEALISLWQQVTRVGKPGSRIIFRTAAENSPLETALPEKILSRFSYDADISKGYFNQDRSAIYGGFHLYIMDR